MSQVLVLACDGIWDVCSNDDVFSLIQAAPKADSVAGVCNHLLDECLARGSKDNMTLLLVTFPGSDLKPQRTLRPSGAERETSAHRGKLCRYAVSQVRHCNRICFNVVTPLYKLFGLELAVDEALCC
jgi:hypothetical protein